MRLLAAALAAALVAAVGCPTLFAQPGSAPPPAADAGVVDGAPTSDTGDAGVPENEPTGVPAPPTAPAAPTEAAPTTAPIAPVKPPVQWTEWDLEGTLLDDQATLRAVLGPRIEAQRVLTDDARAELRTLLAGKLGYHLLSIETSERAGGGTRAVLHLQPLPMVRRVDINVSQMLEFWAAIWQALRVGALDDDIRRRMSFRPGAYLAWEVAARNQARDREAAEIASFLHDEGFFDARVAIKLRPDGVYGMIVDVDVELGEAYVLGRLEIDNERDLAIDGATLREVFRHRSVCVLGGCILSNRFTRDQFQADIQTVAEMFRRRGYPAVKVTSNFDPKVSFNRRDSTVRVTLHIDQRRRVDVAFEGNDKGEFPDDGLRDRLTFREAATADEFEIEASARAIQTYYQSRGYFDAVVTWTREPFHDFDVIVYAIDEGAPRRVFAPTFCAAPCDGSRPTAIGESELRDTVTLRETPPGWATSWRSDVRPTADMLAEDAERLRELYRHRGYGRAQVRVEAAPDPAALDSPAVAGALVASGKRGGELHVRFVIDEGPRTLVDRIHVRFEGSHRATCAEALGQIGAALGVDDLPARAAPADPCTAVGVDVPALSDDLDGAGKKLGDWYWTLGRAGAEISAAYKPSPSEPTNTDAEYVVTEHDEVRIGKVLVRGNFRTRSWIIREELDFEEGQLFTDEAAQRGPARVRATNLFNAVSIELVDPDDLPGGPVNVVVRVEERKDVDWGFQGELGYSTLKGFFTSARATRPNWRHLGIELGLGGTYGVTVGSRARLWLPNYGTVDGSIRLPHWLVRRAFDTEIAAFARTQDTERFGVLTTLGGSVAATHAWQRPRSERASARSIALTVRYDYRYRHRDDEAVRAAGASLEDRSVPVKTISGAVGVEAVWDQRLDRRGNLSPLVPERGFELQAGVSFASPLLLGEDTFIKAFAAGQTYWTVTDRLKLRIDGRLDHGFPLRGAVLLPEVERFFAGGDTTVRGYEEDRLATEIIEERVPPLGGITQIRVLPAGGNIRAVGSIDAQIPLARISSVPLASAVFIDAGIVRNTWQAFTLNDIRPSVGISLVRVLTAVGAFAIDYAVPLAPHLGDDPRGRIHISVALRN